jgi:hypothetical protein
MANPTTKELLLSAPDFSAMPEPSDWTEHGEGKTWWEGPGIGVSTYNGFYDYGRSMTINMPAPHFDVSLDVMEKFLHDILTQAKEAGVDSLRFVSDSRNQQWHEAIWSMSRAGIIRISTVSGPTIYAGFG